MTLKAETMSCRILVATFFINVLPFLIYAYSLALSDTMFRLLNICKMHIKHFDTVFDGQGQVFKYMQYMHIFCLTN